MALAPVVRGTIGILTVTAAVAAAQVASSRRPPDPVGAIDGILDAFRSHAIVGVPDAHGDAHVHAFLLSLVRDPRFVQTVDDIVVEFGNARYQDVVDQFVRGGDVPYESLRRAWRDSTQPSIAADLSTYEEFLRVVRDVNASARPGRQLRVLLGDPPIDWEKIHTKDEHFKFVEMRDAHPAAVLQLEVIAKQRRALLVYGTGHLQRRNVLSNFEMDDWRAETIVSLVERAGPTRVFTVAQANPAAIASEVTAWRAPSLAPLRGTTLGSVDAARYFGPPRRFAVRDGKLVPLPKEEWRALPAEDQFDALLYLGPSPAAASPEPLSRKLCTEPGYVAMRLKRIALVELPPDETARVKQLCPGASAQ
jgi:hypothetical protein